MVLHATSAVSATARAARTEARGIGGERSGRWIRARVRRRSLLPFHGRHQHAGGDEPEHEVVDVARSTDVDRAPGTVKRVTSGGREALGEDSLTFAAVVGGLLAVPGPFDLLAFGPWRGAGIRRSVWAY